MPDFSSLSFEKCGAAADITLVRKGYGTRELRSLWVILSFLISNGRACNGQTARLRHNERGISQIVRIDGGDRIADSCLGRKFFRSVQP